MEYTVSALYSRVSSFHQSKLHLWLVGSGCETFGYEGPAVLTVLAISHKGLEHPRILVSSGAPGTIPRRVPRAGCTSFLDVAEVWRVGRSGKGVEETVSVLDAEAVGLSKGHPTAVF